MKTSALTAFTAAVLILALSGCANLRTLATAQQIDQQIRADRIRFYDRMSDAYRILAYEYYKLAATAEKQNESALVDECRTRVTLYQAFSDKAKHNAEELRASERGDRSDELPAIAPPARASAPARTYSTPAAPRQRTTAPEQQQQ